MFKPTIVAATLIATAPELSINGAIATGFVNNPVATAVVERFIVGIARWVLCGRGSFAIFTVIDDLGHDTCNGETRDNLGDIIAVSSSRCRCNSNAKSGNDGEREWCNSYHVYPQGFGLYGLRGDPGLSMKPILGASGADAQYRDTDMRYQETIAVLLLIFSAREVKLDA